MPSPSPSPPPPIPTSATWFTPERLLALFCAMSMLIYLDRGVISSAAVSGAPGTRSAPLGSGLQGEFDIGYAEYGLLQAAFMTGLLIGCPIFSSLSKRRNPFKLIGGGLACWTVATFLCGVAPNYASLFVARAVVGVGEASFCALAAPFIDDYAPPSRKTTWLATFYLCIPLGIAFGFMYGGVVGSALGWRWAFILESVAMAPVVAFCADAAPVPMRGVNGGCRTHSGDGGSDGEEEELGADGSRGGREGAEDRVSLLAAAEAAAAAAEAATLEGGARGDADDGDVDLAVDIDDADAGTGANEMTASATLRRRAARDATRAAAATKTMRLDFLRDASQLAKIPVYVLTVAAYVAYTAVVGVYAVWGPKAGYAIYGSALKTRGDADFALGGITVVAGVVGTLLGGRAVDAFGASRRAAITVCAVSSVAAFALLEASFQAPTFAIFACVFLIGETLAFVVQAPVNAVILWSVPPGTRPLACSMTTVLVHAFGDVPTPPLFGAALSATGRRRADGAPTPDDWRRVLSAFTTLMAVAAVVFAAAAPAARRSVDYRAAIPATEGGARSPSRGGGRRGSGDEGVEETLLAPLHDD